MPEPPGLDEIFPPNSIEKAVLKALKSVMAHPDTWEERTDPDMSDDERGRRTLRRCIDHLRCHGFLISHLALYPHTRIELRKQMDRTIEFVPAWEEAGVFGVEKMSGRLFAVGQCQVLRVHRAGIERIFEEQILNPEFFQEILDDAPIPEAHDEEPGNQIMSEGGLAMTAHARVLVDLGHSLDRLVEGLG